MESTSENGHVEDFGSTSTEVASKWVQVGAKLRHLGAKLSRGWSQVGPNWAEVGALLAEVDNLAETCGHIGLKRCIWIILICFD